jgi:hypothetical protein
MKNVIKAMFIAVIAMSVSFAYAQDSKMTKKSESTTVKTDKKGKKTVKKKKMSTTKVKTDDKMAK